MDKYGGDTALSQVLNLRDNRVGEQGSAEMMEAFRDNCEVHTIDLSKNQIGRLGVSVRVSHSHFSSQAIP